MSGMVSILDVADPEMSKVVEVFLVGRDKKKFPLEVEYWPNRLTMEPLRVNPADEDDEDDELGRTSLRNATSFCDMMKAWKLTGPVRDRTGTYVVGPDEVVPLEPRIVRLLPTWMTTQITNEIMDIEFPDRAASRRGRGR